MFVSGLSCWACGAKFPADKLMNLCPCGKPLRVDYDLEAVAESFSPSKLVDRPFDLWRFRELLPLPRVLNPLNLGEGGTPLLKVERLAQEIEMAPGKLFVKDEALNPTGSFKARGMATAVAMAGHLGAKCLSVPSAGNAGGAMAAYAAAYGLDAHVFLPRDAPAANILEKNVRI